MSEPVQSSHANDKSIVVNILYYRNSKCISSKSGTTLEKITYCKVLIITIVKTFKKLQKMFHFWIFFLQKHFVELCGGQSNDGVHTGDVGPVGPRFSGDSE